MTDITAALVKQLRDATNVSMMECKRALVESGGDIEQATTLLRERGIAVAAKRASKAANQGIIASAFAENNTIASLVELNCETDFVARNERFQAFAAGLAEKACTTDEPLAEQVKNEVMDLITAIGENIVVRRNSRFVLEGTGRLGSYVHLGGKVGVLVEVGCEQDATAANPVFEELVKDLTLHVAACNPRYLKPGDVPESEIQAEREIYAKQVDNKPPQIVEKIVDGKLRKYFAEICLLDQEFVKEQKVSVSQLLAAKGKELGDTLTLRRFARYQLGE
ncbi:MAG: translation elongation factor Ts [Lentisphaerae bacterium]|nr:translation elongation factor Ts [Lentisphaerota bacterium]